VARSEWSNAPHDSSPERSLIGATLRAGTRTLIAASGIGALVVFVFLAAILPAPSGTPTRDAILFNIALFVPYMALVLWLGAKYGRGMVVRRLDWLTAGREPTAAEQRATPRLDDRPGEE
jgi:hypothetical protein